MIKDRWKFNYLGKKNSINKNYLGKKLGSYIYSVNLNCEFKVKNNYFIQVKYPFIIFIF